MHLVVATQLLFARYVFGERHTITADTDVDEELWVLVLLVVAVEVDMARHLLLRVAVARSTYVSRTAEPASPGQTVDVLYIAHGVVAVASWHSCAI